MSKVYVGLGGYRAQLVHDQVVKFHNVGGGFQKSISLERFLAEFKEETEPPKMRAATFQIESGEQYPGFHKGDLWNGWAMPLFTHEVVVKMAEDTNMEGYSLEYVPATDEWLYVNQDYADEGPDTYPAEVITVDGVEHKVFAVGAGFWCWDVNEIEGEK